MKYKGDRRVALFIAVSSPRIPVFVPLLSYFPLMTSEWYILNVEQSRAMRIVGTVSSLHCIFRYPVWFVLKTVCGMFVFATVCVKYWIDDAGMRAVSRYNCVFFITNIIYHFRNKEGKRISESPDDNHCRSWLRLICKNQSVQDSQHSKD